ncbi:SDR family NAD(P)-dependent oxidoreductase [Actinomadura nitritigenes]|uniref:SDR family NAD(P)-dependent oxidoreductase n=1 Tax=Actinomadura nitritigenes TaxID=134602 RepID=UPI003D913751
MSTWFITGAAGGLGLEIARAAVAGGHAVVAAACTREALPEDLQRSGRVLAYGSTSPAASGIAGAVATTVKRLGGIDVLVNNAGRGPLGALEEITDAEARSLFDLNVCGLINLTRAVLPGMRAAGGGKIVNIGSSIGAANITQA